MKKKPITAASGIYGNAYGTVYAGEFTVQHRRQLFLWQRSVSRR